MAFGHVLSKLLVLECCYIILGHPDSLVYGIVDKVAFPDFYRFNSNLAQPFGFRGRKILEDLNLMEKFCLHL